MEQEKKINISIADGEEFFAHEVTVNFNPSQFIYDFKCITPRSDPRNQQGPTLAIKHNTVMLDVYHAKKFHQLMGEVIAKYEKDFGKITKPKAVEKAEKMRPKSANQPNNKTTVPSYFG
jgi:hypothetical protein